MYVMLWFVQTEIIMYTVYVYIVMTMILLYIFCLFVLQCTCGEEACIYNNIKYNYESLLMIINWCICKININVTEIQQD